MVLPRKGREKEKGQVHNNAAPLVGLLLIYYHHTAQSTIRNSKTTKQADRQSRAKLVMGWHVIAGFVDPLGVGARINKN